MTQIIQHLPTKYKALSSNTYTATLPHTNKTKQKQNSRSKQDFREAKARRKKQRGRKINRKSHRKDNKQQRATAVTTPLWHPRA
jgi:hypothetical protein